MPLAQPYSSLKYGTAPPHVPQWCLPSHRHYSLLWGMTRRFVTTDLPQQGSPGVARSNWPEPQPQVVGCFLNEVAPEALQFSSSTTH